MPGHCINHFMVTIAVYLKGRSCQILSLFGSSTAEKASPQVTCERTMSMAVLTRSEVMLILYNTLRT